MALRQLGNSNRQNRFKDPSLLQPLATICRSRPWLSSIKSRARYSGHSADSPVSRIMLRIKRVVNATASFSSRRHIVDLAIALQPSVPFDQQLHHPPVHAPVLLELAHALDLAKARGCRWPSSSMMVSPMAHASVVCRTVYLDSFTANKLAGACLDLVPHRRILAPRPHLHRRALRRPAVERIKRVAGDDGNPLDYQVQLPVASGHLLNSPASNISVICFAASFLITSACHWQRYQ